MMLLGIIFLFREDFVVLKKFAAKEPNGGSIR
jgi:hypothetical protein